MKFTFVLEDQLKLEKKYQKYIFRQNHTIKNY